MAPIGQPMTADEAMEMESDFQNWTLELDAMNKQYGALQATEDATLETTITAIENQIRNDADGLFANLNTYMQQCLEKMRQEMNASVSRQVLQRLQLEKTKAEFEARRRQRSEAKKKQVVELFDKHHFANGLGRRQTSLTFQAGQNNPPPQLPTKASHLQNAQNGHASMTGSPRPTTASSSLTSNFHSESSDDRAITETSQAQSTRLADRPTSATPGAAQTNRATPTASGLRAFDTAATIAETSRAHTADADKVVDSVGYGASKRKVDTFNLGPADTAKRARVDPSKEEAPAASPERQLPSTPQRRSSRSAASQHTVSFAEIYQDGDAVYKHSILEYMEGSGKFYILKCEEHHVHFGSNPLAGAAKHLSSVQHNKLPKTHELAIEKLGYLVYDCTRELADKNNAHFLQALRNGYEPFNANRLTKSERLARGIELTDSPTPHQENSTRKSKGTEMVDAGPASERQFRGITDAEYGQLYLGYWSKTKTKFPVIVLPLGNLKAAGLKGTLLATSLRKTIPKCYVVTRPTPDTKAISGWAKGYEDGGPLVTKREFPVMYFDKQYLVGWIAARHLSKFDFDDPNPGAYPEYFTARDYWARVQDEGCSGYDDWVARGSIRNPTVSPQPPPSTRASPGTGDKDGVSGSNNANVQSTVPPVENPVPADVSDDRLDHEMVDVDAVRDNGGADGYLANPSHSGEAMDVDMNLGNEEFPSATRSQTTKEPEYTSGENALGISVAPALSNPTAITRPLEDRLSPKKNVTVAPEHGFPPSSSKASGSLTRPLFIPTPLNSTEVSPITTTSPVITMPSSSVPNGNPSAQRYANQTLGVDSTRRPNSPASVSSQANLPDVTVSRESVNSPRLETTDVRGSRDRVALSDGHVNGPKKAIQPVLPESITVKPPAVERPHSRHQHPKQTFITTSSVSSTPIGNTPGMLRMGSGGPTSTAIRETIEFGHGTSSARNIVSSQKEIPTAGRHLQAAVLLSKLPVSNGGAGDRAQTHTGGTQLPPRPDARVRADTNGAQLPARPDARSPVPTVRSSFGHVVPTRPTSSASSISPSLGPYRSTSSTPTPASEVISRKGTPTIIRGDSLDRWKAVRHPSSNLQSSHSSYLASGPASEGSRGLSASQERRGFSLSSIMTDSTPGYSSFTSESMASGKGQYFDVVGYTDSTDSNSFVKQDNSPYLRLTVNTARGIAETAPGEAIAVTIKPRDVLKVVVKNIDQDKAAVALTLNDPDSRPEYWAFGTKSTGGRPVSGKIQARLFCQWIRSMNPSAHYENAR